MAEHKFGEMDSKQSDAAWGYFVNFWKYFFALCIFGVIFLAMVTL